MLYSAEKGTGKSTFCKIAERLFGELNTSVQNNIEKVAAKFNGPILVNKLIVCEEVQLRPNSDLGNTLKTLITSPNTTTEHKGRNVEKVSLFSCFLMNSNHLPLWLEPGERRVYVVDVAHDGHASGPKAAAFSQQVKDVEAALRDDTKVAALYHALLRRKLADDFDAFSLNTALYGTEVMKRVLTSSTPATTQQLSEFLGREGTKAVTEQDLRVYVSKEMRLSTNSIRHMMTDLGWTRHEVKWGGKDYARAIWVAPHHTIDRGNIFGPGGYEKAVCDVLWASEQ
jgi:transcription antitermination factor NusG